MFVSLCAHTKIGIHFYITPDTQTGLFVYLHNEFKARLRYLRQNKTKPKQTKNQIQNREGAKGEVSESKSDLKNISCPVIQ